MSVDYWGDRPPTEIVLQNMEKYFDDHDLDKEVAGLPSIPSSATRTPQTMPRKGLRRHVKSIRVAAREASKNQLLSVNSDHQYTHRLMVRRKSTKMWDQTVVEVKPEQRQRTPASPLHLTISTSADATASAEEPPVQWIRGKLIGKGSFGRVYLAFNVVSGDMIAVKQVDIPNSRCRDDRQHDMVDALYREIAMLRDLDHENIVQYLGYGVDEQEHIINIFLEYVSGGNVANRLALHGGFDEPVVRHFTRQICQGLAYLHHRHILHRDIKAANILVEADGVCKISDFGLSKKNDYDEAYDQNSRMSLRGSIYWMAPEVVKNEPYSAKVDIWSLGCTVLEMFTGQRPWISFSQIAALYNLGHSNAPDIPDTISDFGRDFITKCFNTDPNLRPTAMELLSHPFCAEDPGFNFEEYVVNDKV
ncbi:kinase-like protein [Hesseltinella vesiculosa]|uniref:Kinase-like protein n=1 Tax=Hesseltinella vesiculosa TaxID=101127 RepID=A0A1X2GDL7_9FUNG|nr:kinase-like protein [Hesseltinella vesiculosa]